MGALRFLRRFLKGKDLDDGTKGDLFSAHTHSYMAATFAVRFLYVITLWPTLNRLGANWLTWRTATDLDLVWPVAWFSLVDPRLGTDIIGLLALISLILVVIFPQSRWVRILAFVGYFMMTAFGGSFGKINHDMHAWMAFMFAFIFLPVGNWKDGAKSVRFRQRFLTAFWFGMMLMTLFYTMSGILKVIGIGYQVSHGMISALHPYGLSYQVMGRLLETNSESIFGPLLLDHPLVGWPMYIGAIYLELLALVAVFRPRLHPLWGFGLMVLHIGNWLLLAVPFTANVILLALFFVNSPFRPSSFDIRATVRDLPGIGWVLGRFL